MDGGLCDPFRQDGMRLKEEAIEVHAGLNVGGDEMSGDCVDSILNRVYGGRDPVVLSAQDMFGGMIKKEKVECGLARDRSRRSCKRKGGPCWP